MMKNVLITGASGFIGSNLARRLIKDGYQVHLLLRPGYQTWRIDAIKDSVCLHTVDLQNKMDVAQMMRAVNPRWIFHLAAYGAYSQQDDYTQAVLTNILGIHHLIEAGMECGVESFVNVGSSSEYGFKDHAPRESEPLEPNSYYALTKAYASKLCQYSAQKKKVNFITLRPYSVYGPYEEPTRLLPTIILHAMEGQWPKLVSPDTARDFIYVDDFVDACLLAARSARQFNGAVYNVGTGTQTTLQQVVDVMKQEFDIKQPPVWGTMENRSWDTNVWVSDSRQIKEDLGWNCRINFKDGFRKLTKWFHEDKKLLEYYKAKIFKSVNAGIGR